MGFAVSIVYPCYNPPTGWEKLLVKSHKSLLQKIPPQFKVQLVLVNDGSTSGVDACHIDYISNEISDSLFIETFPNQGKGAALRTAMSHIPQGHIIYTDIDFPYSEQNVIEMFLILAADTADVVVGTRPLAYYRQLPFKRLLLSVLLRFSVSILFPSSKVKDTQSGLKGFNQRGKEVFLNTTINGYLVDAEFVLNCARKRLRLRKIALQIKDDVQFSSMKWTVVKGEVRNFFRLVC